MQSCCAFLMSSNVIFFTFPPSSAATTSLRRKMFYRSVHFRPCTGSSTKPSLTSLLLFPNITCFIFFQSGDCPRSSVFTSFVDSDILLHSSPQLQTLCHWFFASFLSSFSLGLLVHLASCNNFPHLLLLLTLSHEHTQVLCASSMLQLCSLCRISPHGT